MGQGATYIDGAGEVLVPHQDVGQEKSEYKRENPCAEESLDGLFRGQLYQLCSPEGYTNNVGEDVIGDNQTDWQEEPDHALKHIVHNKVGLDNNEIEGHVGPCELRKLKSVMPGL